MLFLALIPILDVVWKFYIRSLLHLPGFKLFSGLWHRGLKHLDNSKMTTTVKGKWSNVQWFSAGDTSEERRFLLKLDVILVPFLLITYWVKNLDQNNLSE